jgi:hypothetical protein
LVLVPVLHQHKTFINGGEEFTFGLTVLVPVTPEVGDGVAVTSVSPDGATVVVVAPERTVEVWIVSKPAEEDGEKTCAVAAVRSAAANILVLNCILAVMLCVRDVVVRDLLCV